MTRHAINRHILFTMTLHAESHGVVHHAHGHGLLGHIAVAFSAVHFCANVRRVIELHMRGRKKSVHSLPRDVFAARAIGRELLDLRLVGGDHLMASHTKIDARDSGVRASIDAHVAVCALHTIGQMHFVSVRDRLDGFLARTKELVNGVHDSAMLGREDRGTLRHRLGWRGRILGGRCSLDQRQRQDNHAEKYCNAKTTFQAEIRPRQITLFRTQLGCEGTYYMLAPTL